MKEKDNLLSKIQASLAKIRNVKLVFWALVLENTVYAS